MLSAVLLTVLSAGAVLGPAAAQNSLYSDGGCRKTGHGSDVNVTCTCNQRLRQTDTSQPINHLTIVGCLADDPLHEREVRLAFVKPRRAAHQLDFILPLVRSVNISQIRLRLEPTRGALEAADVPLQRLHIELCELTDGLRDGALQGLANLERLSMDLVTGNRVLRSALADLPLLQELAITNSIFQFVNTGAVRRTPRLRRLQFAKSQFDFMGSDAIDVESDADDDVDGSGKCHSDDSDDSFLNFSNMVVNTMNTNAVRVGAVRRLLASNNSIGVMYSGALNVTLQAPDGCRPLVRFTENTVTDVRGEAVAIENVAATPAYLELGANVLISSALSSHELRLKGSFERRPVAGLPPDQFDCSCCECPGTRQLIEVTLQPQPTPLDKAVFVTALARARCAGHADRSFLEFAASCVPDSDLTARVASLVPLPTPPPGAGGSLAPLPALLLPLALAAAARG